MDISMENKVNFSKKRGFLFWTIGLSFFLVLAIIVAIAVGSTYIEP